MLLSEEDRNNCRKPQPAQMQRTTECGMPSPSEYIYNVTPAPKGHRTLSKTRRKYFKSLRTRKREWKNCKNRRIRKSALRLCFLEMRMKFHPGYLNRTGKRIAPIDMLMRKSCGTPPKTKNYRQPNNTVRGRISYPCIDYPIASGQP